MVAAACSRRWPVARIKSCNLNVDVGRGRFLQSAIESSGQFWKRAPRAAASI